MTRWSSFGPLAGIALAALVASGCATQSLRRVEAHGATPAVGRYALAEDPEAPIPAGLAEAVARRLAALRLTRGDDQPDLRVEAAYSERQGPVGGFNDVDAKGRPVWAARPATVRWWSWDRRPRLRQLTVRVTDARSGAEVYRGTAVQQGGKGPADWDALAAAALDPAPAEAR